MRPVAIDEFVAELNSIPEKYFNFETIYDCLKTHPVEERSLIPYLFFNSRQPARNLIFKNDLFEVLAVCWEIGQSTSIQGFGECHCWLAVSVGRLRLQMFRLLEENEQTGHYRLEQADEFDIHHSSPAVVSKAEPVHQLFNPPDLAQRCVSLQVFSPPLVQAYHYSIEENRRTTARLDYDSRYGGVEPRE